MSPERRHHQLLELQQNIESLGVQELEAFAFSPEEDTNSTRAHFLASAAIAHYAFDAVRDDVRRSADALRFKELQDQLLARLMDRSL